VLWLDGVRLRGSVVIEGRDGSERDAFPLNRSGKAGAGESQPATSHERPTRKCPVTGLGSPPASPPAAGGPAPSRGIHRRVIPSLSCPAAGVCQGPGPALIGARGGMPVVPDAAGRPRIQEDLCNFFG